jgi:hypothetical protein
MSIYKISICLLVALSLQAKADNHCYDYPDDADCKEEVVDLLDLFTGGSKTDSSKYPDGALEVRNYSIFSDEGDHFKELAEQEKFLSASKLFDKYEDSYFYKEALLGGKTPVDKLQDEINKVASGLRAKKNPMVLRKISLINDELSLVNSSNISLAPKWTHLSELIEDANQTYDDYKSIRIIELSSKQDNLSLKLHEKIKLLKRELKTIAPKEFDRFDFSSNRDFFKDYPVKLNKLEVIQSSSKTVFKWLNNSTLDDAIALIDKYNLNSSKTIRDKLAGVLLDKASRTTYGDKQPKFMDIVATLKQIQDLGIHIEPSALPTRYKTTFVVINSTKDFDTLKDVLSKDEPYLVVIDKRKLDTQKSNGTLSKIHSKYISRRENVSNPDYVSGKRRYNNTLNAYNAAAQNHRNALQAQEESRRQYQREQDMRQLNAGSSTNCSGYGNNINCTTSRNTVMFVPDYSAFNTIGISMAQNSVNKARAALSNAERRLGNIPREVEKLVYSDYSFATRTYEVIKNYDYNIYVINKATSKYFLTNIPQESKQTFVVTNDLNSQDANHKPTDFQTLDDLEIFISGGEDHSIGDLMSKIPSEYSLVEYSDIKGLINNIKTSYKEPPREAIGDAGATSKAKPTDSDYIKDLQRIKALLDSGVIDQDDFETLKQKIINKL